VLRGQAGGITFGTFFFLFLIAGSIYLALLYLPPWIAYYAMFDQIREQAGTSARVSDEEIVNRIMATAKEWEVPITPEQIEVNRTDTRVLITAQWDVTINLFGGQYQHVLHFAPSAGTLVMPPAR